MILVVALNPALDITYEVDRLSVGETNRVAVVHEQAGGKALNVARVLATLGHDVTLVALTPPALVEQWPPDRRIRTVWVQVAGPVRRTVAVVERTSGEVTLFNEPGPAAGEAWAPLFDAVGSLLPSADALVLSGSVPPGLPVDAYAQLIDLAHPHKVFVALDTADLALLPAVAAGPGVVKVNLTEARAAVPSATSPEEAAEALRVLGAEAAVVSLGADGMVAATPHGPFRMPARPVAAGNPTGAGDAALAALVSATLEDLPWPECLRSATALAATAVEHPVAGVVRPPPTATTTAGTAGTIPRQSGANLGTGLRAMLWTLAVDHRDSFRRGFLGVRGAGKAEDAATARRAKGLVLEALLLAREHGIADGEPAILVDEEYGADVIARARAEELTVVVPVEASGRAELAFEHGDLGWAAAIERVDPSYVKVLIRHNPEGDTAANHRQVDRLVGLQRWLDANSRDWMLELLVPPTADTPDDWDDRIRPELVAAAVDELVAAGLHPAFWKLEGMPTAGDFADVASRTNGTCLVLGRGADTAVVDRWLTLAAGVAGYGGFAVGRTLWWQPLRASLDGHCSEQAAVEAIAANYRRIIDLYSHEAKAAHVDRS